MASRYAAEATSLAEVIAELIREEHVPYLAGPPYTGDGILKRAQWERTWDQQRKEDETGRLRQGPVPPKYTSADYLKPAYWRQRGKFDVPNERFVSPPRTAGRRCDHRLDRMERAANGHAPSSASSKPQAIRWRSSTMASYRCWPGLRDRYCPGSANGTGTLNRPLWRKYVRRKR